MGYNPNYWGKQGWHFIHFVCLNYPDQPSKEDKTKYKSFFELLPIVMPCPPCGINFEENMKKHAIRLESKKELFEWSVDMHNEVNKETNKRIITYDEAYKEVWYNANLNLKHYKKNSGAELGIILRKLKNQRR